MASPVQAARSLFFFVALASIASHRASAYNFTSFSIAVLSDSPYEYRQVVAIPKLVRALNEFPVPLHAVVHVGDYKDGGNVMCNDTYMSMIKNDFFDRIVPPLLFTPGDNDWTDCHRVDNGRFYPLERLAAIRSLFYRNPLLSGGAAPSGGRAPLRLDSQMLHPPHSMFVENSMWTHGGVVFGVLHTVGSNNGKYPWKYLAGGDDPQPRLREVHARIKASVAWVHAVFDRAEDAASPGVAIFTQAGFWPSWEIATNEPLDGFDAIVQALAARAARFDKPVWLINGDQHDWVVLTPFTPGATHPDTAQYGVANASVYRIHGEQYDAVKFTAFTLETYQKYDKGKPDYDPDYAFDIFQLKVNPTGGDAVFSYERHKVRYSDYEGKN